MRLTKRLAAVCAAATLTVVSATSAVADDLDNGLDGGIDTTHESMSLQYDDVHHIAGPAGHTTVTLIAVSTDSHKNCNLPGGVTLTLTPVFEPQFIDVELANNGVIDSCDVPLDVTVTPVSSVATTTVTFSGQISTSDNASLNDFTYDGAAFDVSVTNVDLSGGGGSGTVCDADPAAPAWAAALLKGNNVKAKGTTYSNYISAVAQHMGPRATFGVYDKPDHEGYENAVWQYMQTLPGLGGTVLAKGPHHADVIKPGWECTPVPGTVS